jgi:hypothetical protein
LSAPAALGFQARTGWAALVVVAGPVDAPVVAQRSRVELVDADVPAHVYHAARDLDRRAAGELVKRAQRVARAAARRAIRQATRDLRASGREVVGVGLGVGESKLPGKLEAILASHALVHAAEGELYRDALVGASESCHLPVTAIGRRQLGEMANQPPLRRRLADMGKALGPPWRQEHKEAALAAWNALEAYGR